MTIETEIIRGIAVTILFISYLVLWSLRRKLLQTKEGFDPDVLDTDKRPTQLYFRFMSNLMTFALITLLILHTVGLKQVPGFYYIFEIQDSLSAVIGFLIGFAGILICLFAQIEMGTSWRVGIDKQRTTKLIVSGIFSYCRNSTYIGLFLVCLQHFLFFQRCLFWFGL